MKEFVVFGKENCDLCKKRLESIKKYKEKFKKDYEIKYLSVDESSGLVEFSMLSGSKEIPYVILKEDDEILKIWNGPTEFPRTKELNEIL